MITPASRSRDLNVAAGHETGERGVPPVVGMSMVSVVAADRDPCSGPRTLPPLALPEASATSSTSVHRDHRHRGPWRS
jgi:hypothetical protein